MQTVVKWAYEACPPFRQPVLMKGEKAVCGRQAQSPSFKIEAGLWLSDPVPSRPPVFLPATRQSVNRKTHRWHFLTIRKHKHTLFCCTFWPCANVPSHAALAERQKLLFPLALRMIRLLAL